MAAAVLEAAVLEAVVLAAVVFVHLGAALVLFFLRKAAAGNFYSLFLCSHPVFAPRPVKENMCECFFIARIFISCSGRRNALSHHYFPMYPSTYVLSPHYFPMYPSIYSFTQRTSSEFAFGFFYLHFLRTGKSTIFFIRGFSYTLKKRYQLLLLSMNMFFLDREMLFQCSFRTVKFHFFIKTYSYICLSGTGTR